MELPISDALLEELHALARAQRRVLRVAHKQIETDPLLAHLLASRVSYRKADEHRTKSGKHLEHMVHMSFQQAEDLGFRGRINEWRDLLAIYPR